MPERRGRRILGWIILLAIIIGAAFGWREYRRQVELHPERFPWTPLSLAHPTGQFTGRKLAGLADDPGRCAALREAVGLPSSFASPVDAGNGQCGYRDGLTVRLPGAAAFSPALVASCPVASALWLWDRDVVQPAARRHLGTGVARYRHFGSYNCRRMYGSAEGPFSEHATADAVDIAGFVLGDGRSLSVKRDWQGGDPAARAFLREVRDGGCELFSTSLSPDYNAAHADHFHFDMAERGRMGWKICR